MNFALNDSVMLGVKTGIVVARVRADDDPRKCAPNGCYYSRRGGIAERDRETYLVRMDGDLSGRLEWTHGKPFVGIVAPPAALMADKRSVLTQAQSISDGTMAAMTGLREPLALSQIRTKLVQHIIVAESTGLRFANWQEAWRWLLNVESVCELLPAYRGLFRLFVMERTGKPPQNALWVSEDGTRWIASDEAPFSDDEAAAGGLFGESGKTPVRAGFVVKHLLVGKAAESFIAWLANTSVVGAAA